MADRLDSHAHALLKAMDDRGIHTAAVVFRDPDSESVVSLRRGDACWLSGALRMVEQELTDNWVTVRRPICDGDHDLPS